MMTITHNSHDELTRSLIASIQHENAKNAREERNRYSAINSYADSISMELRQGNALDDMILKKVLEIQALAQSEVIVLDDEWKDRQ